MLDMGFLPDIRAMLALLPRKRQNLLFSATFPTRSARSPSSSTARARSRSRRATRPSS
jgi:superfamily II DNA/RNA helicase